MMKAVTVKTETIPLQALLKWCGAAETGGEAKIFIQEGRVTVNGEVCLMRGKKLHEGDIVGVEGQEFRIVR